MHNAVVTEKAQENIISRQVFDVFRRFVDRHIVFVEPGGNHGDHLIYKGAYKLARLANIKYTIYDFDAFQAEKFLPEQVVYVHGGGGFVPWWSGKTMQILKKLTSEFRGSFILGPTTFSDNREYLRKILDDCLGGNDFRGLYVFTRDRSSYEILKAYMPCAGEIICDHDTALNLVRSDLLPEPPAGKYVFYALRDDKERSFEQDYDYLRWVDPVKVSSTFEKWLYLHARAKKLITNRTHSAILGSILGIPTVMLPNSYHKNRSVWEFSLAERGVEWQEKISRSPWNNFIGKNKWLKAVCTSRGFKKAVIYRLKLLGF